MKTADTHRNKRPKYVFTWTGRSTAWVLTLGRGTQQAEQGPWPEGTATSREPEPLKTCIKPQMKNTKSARWTSPGDTVLTSLCSLTRHDKDTSPLWFLPQNSQGQSNNVKNLRKTETKGHFTKYPTSTLYSCQGHEKLDKPSQIKEMWWLNVTWYPGLGPGTESQWKNQWNPMKSESSLQFS